MPALHLPSMCSYITRVGEEIAGEVTQGPIRKEAKGCESSKGSDNSNEEGQDRRERKGPGNCCRQVG